jgi:hypothetical protein
VEGGPVHPPAHAKILRQVLHGGVRNVSCDLGVTGQEFHSTSATTGLPVATRIPTTLYASLVQRWRFAKARRALRARLTAPQLAAAARPSAFGAVAAAVDARLAAPPPSELLAKLARLERQSAIRQRRALAAILMRVKRGDVARGTAVGGRIVACYGKPTFHGKQFPVRRLLELSAGILRGPTMLFPEFNGTQCHSTCGTKMHPVERDARQDLFYRERDGRLAGNKKLLEKLERHRRLEEAAAAAGSAPPRLDPAWGFVSSGGLKFCPTCHAFVNRDANAAQNHAQMGARYFAGQKRQPWLTPEACDRRPALQPFLLGRRDGWAVPLQDAVRELPPLARRAALNFEAQVKKTLRRSGAWAGLRESGNAGP